jgi:hypothetical protein
MVTAQVLGIENALLQAWNRSLQTAPAVTGWRCSYRYDKPVEL